MWNRKEVKQQEFDVHKEVVDQQTMIYDLADDTEGDESKPLILVVEDEWDLRKYLVQFLNSRFTIIEASNGKQALDLAVERIPDNYIIGCNDACNGWLRAL